MAYKLPIEIPCTACRVEAGARCRNIIPHDEGLIGAEIDFFHAARVNAAFETFIPRCVDCGHVAHSGEFCKPTKG